MIKKIVIHNVKGLSVDIPVTSPLLAITGPNFSGKSAVLDAIRLALIGYVPALGKRNPDSFKLSNGESMAVALETDAGNVARTWIRDRKGAVKLNTTSTLDEISPQILDIGVFLGASKKEKVSMILASGRASDELAATTKEQVGRSCATLEELEELIGELQADIKTTRAELATFAGTMKGTAEIDADKPVARFDESRMTAAQQALTDAVAAHYRAKEALAVLNRRDEMADAAAEALQEAGDAPAPEGTLEDLRAAVEKAQRDLHAAMSAEVEAAKKEKDNADTIQALNKSLDELTRLGVPWDPDTVEARIAELPETVPVPEIPFPLEDVQARLQDARTRHGVAEGKVGAARHDLQQLDALTCCPTCGAAGETWKEKRKAELQEIIDRERDTAAVDSQLIDELEAHVADIKTVAENFKLDVEKSNRRARLVDLLFLLRKLITLQDASEGLARDADHALENLSECKDALEAANKALALAVAHSRRDAKTAELQQLIKTRPTVEEIKAAHDVLDQTEAAKTAAAMAVRDLELLREESIREKERAASVAAARERHDKAEEKLTELNARAAAAALILATEAAKLWGPILRVAGHFSKMLAGEITMSDGEIGAWRAGTFVPFDALSGTEQLVAAAAIQLGLAATAPVRVLALDELSRMTRDKKQEFTACVGDLLFHGLLDQAVMVDHDTEFWRAAGDWQTFTIEQKTAD